jgi:predicted nucleic acid-binding protein
VLVVSDTSPVRALHRVGLLDLLPAIFGDVLVPPAVRDELLAAPADFTPIRIEDFQFFRLVAPARMLEFAAHLDPGESEAISLADELRADWLLIDERMGHDVAIAAGLRTVGVIGILLRAKQVGKLTLIAPVISKLRTHGRFRLSDAIVSEALKQAGE